MTKLSNGIEPSIKSFLEDVNSQTGPQLYELSVEDAREVLLNVQKMDVKKLPADIEDKNILKNENFLYEILKISKKYLEETFKPLEIKEFFYMLYKR